MFTKNSQGKPVEMLPGVVRRTLNSGDNATLCEISLATGSVVRVHTHPHEQIGYVASGRVLFEIDGLEQELRAGDSYLIPGNVPHGVKTVEQSICIDIFSPVREEYLDGIKEVRK